MSSPKGRPPLLSEVVRGFFTALQTIAKPVAAAVGTWYQVAQAQAAVFAALIPVGRQGWAISSSGLLLAPDEHYEAARLAASNEEMAAAALDRVWLSEQTQRTVADLVAYAYEPAGRPIALRRSELVHRACDRAKEGLYEEAVLLVTSQIDGLFQDAAQAHQEEAYARLFSRRPVSSADNPHAREFRELVTGAEIIESADHAFFLAARDAMTESVNETTLADNLSRHGVLHGRVLGYGTARHVAQTFAFLAACLELLLAHNDHLPNLSEEERDTDFTDLPSALQTIMLFRALFPVHAVYMHLYGRDVLLTEEQRDVDEAAA